MDIQPRISFVILHYENLDDTKHCVDSLLDILRPEHDCSVIIMDHQRERQKLLKMITKNILMCIF